MPKDVYFSADIEADGPIPGPYSMLAFGLAVSSEFDGRTFIPRDPSQATFYRELRPISDSVDPNALRVSHLDRDLLLRQGADAGEAMRAASQWIAAQAGDDVPVLVAYPLAFDWMFLHWYFVRFLGESPFGFAHGLDMKTMYQQKARVSIGQAGRDDLPQSLRSQRSHTHNALDDAIEQADIFNKLFIWRAGEPSPATGSSP